jgi:hypothetical protein
MWCTGVVFNGLVTQIQMTKPNGRAVLAEGLWDVVLQLSTFLSRSSKSDCNLGDDSLFRVYVVRTFLLSLAPSLFQPGRLTRCSSEVRSFWRSRTSSNTNNVYRTKVLKIMVSSKNPTGTRRSVGTRCGAFDWPEKKLNMAAEDYHMYDMHKRVPSDIKKTGSGSPKASQCAYYLHP